MKDSQLYYALCQVCVIAFAATGKYGLLGLTLVYLVLALLNLRAESGIQER